MRFRTVFFDLDGTLVDAFTTIHRAYVHTLPQFGRPAPTLEAVRSAVGGGLADAMGRFLPPDLVPAAMRVHQAFTERILLEDVRANPGADDLLRALVARGCGCAVLTNKAGPASRRICSHLGWDPLLAAVIGAGDTPWLKPSADLALHALSRLGAEASSSCLVGDSPFDVRAAAAGGLSFVGVTTGTHSREELEAAGAREVYGDLVEAARSGFGIKA